MTETPETSPNPYMPTITHLGIENPKIDADMTYLEKKSIDEAICQNLRKKGNYQSNMYKIYNLIVGQTNEKLQGKVGAGRHLPGSQDWPITNRLTDDPKEYLLLK